MQQQVQQRSLKDNRGKELQELLGKARRTINTNPSEALEDIKTALKLSYELEDVYSEAQCYALLGDVYAGLANYRKAIKQYEKAVRLFERQGKQQEEREVRTKMATSYKANGDYKESLVCYQELLDVAKEAKDTVAILELNNQIGENYEE